MTDQPRTYLDPLHDELDRLRAECALYHRRLLNTLDERDAAEKRHEQAEARVDQLTDTLTLRSDALNRTGASNDQLRARLAAASRWLNRWSEHLEDECEPEDGMCHDYDLTDDGRCALVADFEQLRAIIRGDAK